MFQFLARTLVCLVVFLFLSEAVQAREINCDFPREPNPEAALAKSLSDWEHNLRELRLPKETYERLVRGGKESLIKAYHTMRLTEEYCDRERSQKAVRQQQRDDDVRELQRDMQLDDIKRQNEKILENLENLHRR
jgi:hypothetical protein